MPVPPYRIYIIGNSQPENLPGVVEILQQERIRAGVLPKTSLRQGLRSFAEWYKKYCFE